MKYSIETEGSLSAAGVKGMNVKELSQIGNLIFAITLLGYGVLTVIYGIRMDTAILLATRELVDA